MRSFWGAAILNSFAPLLYLVVLYFGLMKYNADAQSAGFENILDACRYLGAEAQGECEELQLLDKARLFAMLAIGAGVAVPLFLFLVPTILGRSRFLLGLFFPLALPFAITATLLISISSIIFVGLSAHVFTTWTLEIVWPYLYIALGLGGLFLLVVIFSAVGTLFSTKPNREFGAVVGKGQVPQLNALVDQLAKELKVRRPKNIIIGTSPNFYITNAKTEVFPSKKLLTGTTLFLSATLSKLLSEQELKSIIAHELMHYKGKDLTYTRTFFPIYKMLDSMIVQLGNSQSEGLAVAGFPLLVNLTPMYEAFSNSERRISRERELAADRGAAKVTSPMHLASALSKVSIFSSVWQLALKDHADALRMGEDISDGAASVYGYAVYECSKEFVDEQFDELSARRMSHPTDTHPTMQDRFYNLGIAIDDVEKVYFDEHQGEIGALVIDDDALRHDVNVAFIYETLASFNIQLPADDDKDVKHKLVAHRIMYQLITHFIRADGKTLPDEVQTAEAIGRRHFPQFNALVFREYVHGTEELIPLDKLSEFASNVFSDLGIESLKEIVSEVIASDGEIDLREAAMLEDFVHSVERSRNTVE